MKCFALSFQFSTIRIKGSLATDHRYTWSLPQCSTSLRHCTAAVKTQLSTLIWDFMKQQTVIGRWAAGTCTTECLYLKVLGFLVWKWLVWIVLCRNGGQLYPQLLLLKGLLLFLLVLLLFMLLFCYSRIFSCGALCMLLLPTQYSKTSSVTLLALMDPQKHEINTACISSRKILLLSILLYNGFHYWHLWVMK